jgi:hypothetical protein
MDDLNHRERFWFCCAVYVSWLGGAETRSLIAGTEPRSRCFTIMLNNERIGRLSWILAGAYLLCGLILFFIGQRVALVVSALQPPLMLPTRLFLWVGPAGWLALMLSFAALMPARHIGFRVRWLHHGIPVALWVALSGVVVGVACLAVVILSQPICVFGSTLAGNEITNGN